LKEITPPVNLNPVNCLNEILNPAIFSASSTVLGSSSSSDGVSVVGSFVVAFAGITV